MEIGDRQPIGCTSSHTFTFSSRIRSSIDRNDLKCVVVRRCRPVWSEPIEFPRMWISVNPRNCTYAFPRMRISTFYACIQQLTTGYKFNPFCAPSLIFTVGTYYSYVVVRPPILTHNWPENPANHGARRKWPLALPTPWGHPN